MLRQEFLRADVDSLLARGEIPDLFSQEEKHQLNEVKVYFNYQVFPLKGTYDAVKIYHS